MAHPDFEEVWQLLRQLEGQSITTLVRRRRNRVLRVLDSKIVRQTETADGKGWEDASDVSKATFRKVWDQLTQTGCYKGPAAFTSACLVNVEALRVGEVVGKSPRTICLKDLAADSQIDAKTIGDEEDNEEFGDRQRIVIDPKICSGKPTIKGTRIMVSNILGMFAGEYSINRILKAYPEISRLDVVSALEYASWIVDREKMGV
jgi:uncharacterized protein (DUF433 family)